VHSHSGIKLPVPATLTTPTTPTYFQPPTPQCGGIAARKQGIPLSASVVGVHLFAQTSDKQHNPPNTNTSTHSTHAQHCNTAGEQHHTPKVRSHTPSAASTQLVSTVHTKSGRRLGICLIITTCRGTRARLRDVFIVCAHGVTSWTENGMNSVRMFDMHRFSIQSSCPIYLWSSVVVRSPSLAF